MDSVEALDEALAVARTLGFEIREDWFDGRGGGPCRIRGRKCLFLDLQLSPRDRLAQVLETLRSEPGVAQIGMSAMLGRLLSGGRAA